MPTAFTPPMESRSCPRSRPRDSHSKRFLQGRSKVSPIEGGRNFVNILKEAQQVWLARESTPSPGTLPLTHVELPQSTGGQKEVKSQNIADPPGVIQVQIPVRIQLDHHLQQYQRSLVKV